MAKIKVTGIYTALMSWIVMLCLGWHFTPHPERILSDVWFFLLGFGPYTASETTGLLAILPCVFLIVAIDFPITVVSGIGAMVVCGKSASHMMNERINQVKEGPFFRVLFIAVFLEELIFRWYCIGQCSQLSLFEGTRGFYFLLFLSNALFAYVHLGNFRDPAEKQWPRVLPQFLSGLFFSYVFVRYGLVASMLAHFASNSILFSLHKVQKTNRVDLKRIILYAVYAFVAWHNMSKPITDALQWVSSEPTFVLPKWNVTDYVVLSVFMTSCFNLIADLLLFDKNISTKTKTPTLTNMIVMLPVMICVFLGISYGTYWIVSQFVHDFVLCVLVSAIAFVSLLHRNPSLSAAQRTFWVGVPSTFITICIIQALGLKGAFIYCIVSFTLAIPQMILARQDD